VAQRNHVLTLGVELSNQDRGLIRLGAAIGEERFLQPSRCDLRQFLGQANMGLIRIQGRGML